jgi:hypothetical protein
MIVGTLYWGCSLNMMALEVCIFHRQRGQKAGILDGVLRRSLDSDQEEE